MLSWEFNYESAILLRVLQVKEIVSNLSSKKCHVFILILVSLFHTLLFSVFEYRWPVDKTLPHCQGTLSCPGPLSCLLARPSTVTLIRVWWSSQTQRSAFSAE